MRYYHTSHLQTKNKKHTLKSIYIPFSHYTKNEEEKSKEYTEVDERIDEIKDRIYDLEDMQKHLLDWLDIMEGNADYDDLSGYFEECIKESDRIINMYKEELDKLLEEPRLYDIYREERME